MTFGKKAATLSGIAAQILGWRPDEFWRATPAELASAFCMNDDAVESVGSEELQRLMACFPDRTS